MASFNFYLILFSVFTIHLILDYANAIANDNANGPYSEEEFDNCTDTIYKKFGGKRYRFDIAVYAVWNLKFKSFQGDKKRYAKDYYKMFAENIYAYKIKSPKRYCNSKEKADVELCENQLLKFGTTKKEALINAFYNVEFATDYLKTVEKQIDVKQATTNPIDFCRNEPSKYKTTEDDLDGKGWEIDNK